MDPTIKTDNVSDSPVQLAAERDYVNILSLFAEHVAENTSSGIKIRLLKLIIECEERQDGPVEIFKKQLGDLSASEVFQHKICATTVLLRMNIDYVFSAYHLSYSSY